jgi:hypothetical protein
VNWWTFWNELFTKEENVWKAVKPFEQLWSIKTKMAIFKAFIRPSGEYCLPLIQRWIDKQPQEMRKEYNEKRNHLWDQQCQWLLHTNSLKKINGSILGLASPTLRSKSLMTSFCWHMANLHHDNPVKDLIASSSVITALKRNSIIHLVSNHPWWTEYCKLRAQSPEATLKTFCRNKWLQDNQLNQGSLHHYITDCCRLRNLMDPCLLHHSKEQAQTFVKWRLNTLCFNKGRCPFCKERLKRTCFDRCALLDNNSDISAIRDSIGFKQQALLLHNKFESIGKVCNFGVIDYCLNKQLYDIAANAIATGLSQLLPI